MTRVALTVERITTAMREAGLHADLIEEVTDLYADAYAEGYRDGGLDAEEAHGETWEATEPEVGQG